MSDETVAHWWSHWVTESHAAASQKVATDDTPDNEDDTDD